MSNCPKCDKPMPCPNPKCTAGAGAGDGESAGADIELGLTAPDDISYTDIYNSLKPIVFSEENIPRVLAACATTLFSIGLNYKAPTIMGQAVEALAEGESSHASYTLVLWAVVHWLSQTIPNIRDQALVPVNARITKSLLDEIATHFIRKKGLGYHRIVDAGAKIQLYNQAFNVAAAIEPLLTKILPTLVEIALATIALSAGYGYSAGLPLALMLTTCIGYSIYMSRFINAAAADQLNEGLKTWDDLMLAANNFAGIHNNGRANGTMEKVAASTTAVSEKAVVTDSTKLQTDRGFILIANVFKVAALLLTATGSQPYSRQEIITLLVYWNQLAALIPSFGGSLNRVLASMPAVRLVVGELNQPADPEAIDQFAGVELVVKDRAPKIEFRNVNFAYPKNTVKGVLKELSFTIAAGQSAALVSESGAGKSTILNLLYRYFLTQDGEILINDQDISKVGLESLRKNISVVSQTPELINGTVRDNIANGAPNQDTVTDEEIMDVAYSAGLGDFIADQGLDTEVGQGGGKLSGGQRQKVAIVRALMKRAPILLLDEVTSGLDSTSAEEILSSLEKMKQNGTVTITITHKLKEISPDDTIIVLYKGKVEEQGTHQQLHNSGGLYSRLWEQQKTKPDRGSLPERNGLFRRQPCGPTEPNTRESVISPGV